MEVIALRNKNISYVVCGWYHCMALSHDGKVYAWGWNRYGQLGYGDTVDSEHPREVKGLESVLTLSAGGYHSIVTVQI
jgi:alpha-tubulin suppressor-like RCC1 family protein